MYVKRNRHTYPIQSEEFNLMNDTLRQECIDQMGANLLRQVTILIDNNQFEDADSVFKEWIVNGRDPEDEEYQFLFLNNLNDI